jgi:hypothetical protein
VPVDTAKSYVRSLLFINEEHDDDDDAVSTEDENRAMSSQEVGERLVTPSASSRLLQRGLSRIEDACGGFAPHHSPTTSDEETIDCHITSAFASNECKKVRRKLRNFIKTKHTVEEIPNLIQGWGDNKFLSRIVRTTPLVVRERERVE